MKLTEVTRQRHSTPVYLAASEVAELADISQRHNDIGRLEVQVNNASIVQVAYCMCDVQRVPVVSTMYCVIGHQC